jgi:hypothetical protein
MLSSNMLTTYDVTDFPNREIKTNMVSNMIVIIAEIRLDDDD